MVTGHSPARSGNTGASTDVTSRQVKSTKASESAGKRPPRSHSHGKMPAYVTKMMEKLERKSPGLLDDPENARLFEEYLVPTETKYIADAVDVKFCKNHKDTL